MYRSYKHYVAQKANPNASTSAIEQTKHKPTEAEIEQFKAAFRTAPESQTAAQNVDGGASKAPVAKPKISNERRPALQEEADRAAKLLKDIENLMATLAPHAKKGEEKLRVLCGDLDVEVKADSRLIRIFTSSTFTDTRHERNALMEKVYSKLKKFCKDRDYDFQVVDMRWGIRDEATNDHMTTELCLKEIQNCQKLSIGPNFVTFLSHKYGYRPLRRVINVEHMHQILTGVSPADQTFIRRWYKLDENSVPAAYVLQPISTNIAHYNTTQDVDLRQSAKEEWWAESTRLMTCILNSARSQFTPDVAHQYLMSVTETEITEALEGTPEKNKHCFWFHRIIQDIDEQAPSELLSKYKDVNKDADMLKRIQEMMTNLKATKLVNTIPPENIKTYQIHWNKTGIDPNCDEHKKYLNDLCTDFENILQERINEAISSNSKGIMASQLCVEVLQHTRFCRDKCSLFYGRETVLQDVKNKLLQKTNVPYVIYGNSGCGKTSLMAKIASQLKTWLGKPPVLVLRFIGTTAESSTLRLMLMSIAEQIKTTYAIRGLVLKPGNISLKLIIAYFHLVLRKASASPTIQSRPLVVVLDSLDQLSNEGNPQALNWIPKQLPENIAFIISTLPDSEQYQYAYLPKLQSMFEKHKDSRFLEVPEIPEDDARATVESWLKDENRALTTIQMELVMDTFAKCKLPLFLKLCFDAASGWSSFTAEDETCLADNVGTAINAMFSTMERKHGQRLTSRTFAYITASKRGLSEVELEDILSCDDDVLNDVYQYWTPPIRRLPPLLLVRLKADVSQYLVERGTGGVKVIYWYHRQFIETARARYLDGEHMKNEQRQLIHRNIAEYYLGNWSNDTEKPFTTLKDVQDAKCRYVTPQPIKTKDKYNLRKLEELPMQLVLADMFTECEEAVVLNLSWHTATIKALSYRELMHDISFAIEHMAIDHDVTEWQLIKDAFSLSEEALMYNVDLLPSQILGRVPEGLETYKTQLGNYDGCALLLKQPTLTPPGGELVHCLAGHDSEMTHAHMTQDETYVVTANEDMSIRVWNIRKAVEVLTIQDCFGDKEKTSINNMVLCCADKYIVVSVHITIDTKKSGDVLFVFNTKTGVLKYKKAVLYSEACPVFKNNTHVAIVSLYQIRVFDVENEDYTGNAIAAKWAKSGTFQIIYLSGADNILCAAHADKRFLWVYDIASRQQLHCIEVEEKTSDDADDDDDDGWTPDLVAVSPNAQTVATVSIMDCNVHVFSTSTGHRIALLKGNDTDSIQRGNFISDTLFAACASRENEVMLWNIEQQRLSYVFPHQESPIKALATKDLQTFVTIADDAVVRVWKPKQDVRNEPKEQTKQTTVLGTISNETVKDLLALAGSSRYVLLLTTVTVNDTEERRYTCLRVYDVYNDIAVRTANFSEASFRTTKIISDKTILILDSNSKLHIFNVDAMCMQTTLQGYCGSKDIFIRNSETDKEVVCLTKFATGLKMISLETGKTTAVINTGLENRLNQTLVVSGDGSTAVVEEDADVNCLLVISLQKKCVLHKMAWKEGKIDMLSLSDEYITNDGRYLIHSAFENVPDVPDWMTTFLLVWDLKEGKVLHTIYDKENDAVREYLKSKRTNSQLEGLDMDKIAVLEDDNVKVITGCTDKSIRVFDVLTGELEHTVKEHHTKDISKLITTANTTNEKGKYCLSLSMEDYVIWLFDVETWSKVACFKADSYWTALVMVDNQTIVGAESASGKNRRARLHVLQIHSGTEKTAGYDPDTLFEHNDKEINITIPEADIKVQDRDDPDTDVAPKEDSESDDESK